MIPTIRRPSPINQARSHSNRTDIMQEYPTVPDASISLWQSAAAAACRNEVCREQPKAPNTDGEAPAVDMSHPLNAATAAYVEASAGQPSSDETVDAMEAESGRRKPEASALFHKLAEARATENQILERSIRMAIEAAPEIDYDEESVWEDVSEYFIDFYRFFKRPLYRSWQKEGNGNIEYGTIEWRLPSHGRVALIADWGTGTREAIQVLRGVALMNPDAIIHLGDIYTTGLTDECEDNFLSPMRRHAINSRTGEPIPVFNLAGNHDYYSGGHGFHWLLDQLNSGAQQQPASYFALRSQDDGWQFLATDTGFNSRTDILLAHNMGSVPREDEIPWLHHKLENFSGRTMLLSHHQAFSNHDRLGGDPDEPPEKDAINQRLMGIFRPYFEKVAGWFWGHEHNLAIYREFMGVKGRCVGHGARPVSIRDFLDLPEPPVPAEKIRLDAAADGRHYNHGFEIIDLNGRGKPADVRYYEVIMNQASDGGTVQELYHEELR